jgi:hypothetical protein
VTVMAKADSAFIERVMTCEEFDATRRTEWGSRRAVVELEETVNTGYYQRRLAAGV